MAGIVQLGLFLVLLSVHGVVGESIPGKNILFLFGGGNYSHKLSIWPLISALTDKGYNVTFVSSASKQPKPNPKVIDLTPQFMASMTENVYKVDRLKDRREGRELIFAEYESQSLQLCNSLMNSKDDPAFTDLITNGNFDLIVINAVFGDCSFFIAHHLKAKYVVFDSTTIHDWYYGIYGIPTEASWIPGFQRRLDYPMSLYNRIQLMYDRWRTYRLSSDYEHAMEEIYRKRFGVKDVPKYIDLHRNASLVLLNSHYTMDFPRSLPPMFINVGGMQCWDEEKELPENFKKFMDGFEDGVILISFGSTIEFNTLSDFYINIFFNMMKKNPKVGFIWRWDGSLPDGHPTNLLASKWMPQKEILREKSVRAFMSHGGMNSMLEATYYGVPIISMPLFADQDFQAYRVQAQELGAKVEAAHFSQEILDDAVWKILNTPKYKENMEIRSRLFRDRENPIDTAVSALEFAMRHKDLGALRPMELGQSFWVRHGVDVWFSFFILIFAFNVLLPYILIKLCRRAFL